MPCSGFPLGAAYRYSVRDRLRPPFVDTLEHGGPPHPNETTSGSQIPFTAGCWYAVASDAEERKAFAAFSLGPDGTVLPFSAHATDSMLRDWNREGTPLTSTDTILAAWAATLGFIAETTPAEKRALWLAEDRHYQVQPFPSAWRDSLRTAGVIGGYCRVGQPSSCPLGLGEGAYAYLHLPTRGHVDTIQVNVTFGHEPDFCRRHPNVWWGSVEFAYHVVPTAAGTFKVSISPAGPAFSDGICPP